MSDPAIPENEQAAATVERAMGRIRRSMARRALGKQIAAELDRSTTDLAVFEAVHAVADAEAGPDDGAPTVGGVAERLGIDQSRGSRLVAAAVAAGYLRREASQADGRRSELRLTPAGRELMDVMRAQRLAHFGRIMAEWTAEERAVFARLLTRFTDAVTTPRA